MESGFYMLCHCDDGDDEDDSYLVERHNFTFFVTEWVLTNPQIQKADSASAVFGPGGGRWCLSRAGSVIVEQKSWLLETSNQSRVSIRASSPSFQVV